MDQFDADFRSPCHVGAVYTLGVLVSGISLVVDPLPGLFIPSLGALVAAVDAAALDQGSLFGESMAEELIDRLRDALRRHEADRLILLVEGGELPDPFTRIASEVYCLTEGGIRSLVLDDIAFGRGSGSLTVQVGKHRDPSGPVCTVLGSRVTVSLALGDNDAPWPEGSEILPLE